LAHPVLFSFLFDAEKKGGKKGEKGRAGPWPVEKGENKSVMKKKRIKGQKRDGEG